MARLPSSSDLQCEDPQCPNPHDSKDIASYGVRETRNLCSHCARKKSREGVILPRGGRRGTTFCHQHGERLAQWFCDSHNVALCEDCKVSCHQACTLQDIEHALVQATFLLQKRLKQVGQKQEEFRRLDAMLQKRISNIDDQFMEKERAIGAVQQEKERLRRERRLPRSRRARGAEHVLRTNADTEDNERKMDEEEAKECLRQLNEGRRRASRLEMKVKEQCKRCLDKTQEAAEQIEQLLIDDNRGMDEIKSTLSDLENILQLSVDTHLMDIAEEFTRGIRYRKGSTSDIGLVEGCKRSLWYLSDSISLPKKIDNPRVRCIDKSEVAVLDGKDKVVYRVNPQSKEVQKLGDDRPITDFIRWQDDKIVCIDDGGIDMSVYSGQWQYLQGISHPGLVFENLTVGSCGNLLVRADGGRVYAIKPTCDMRIQPKNFVCINIDSISDLVGLPSGHLIVKQHESTFIVLDEKGTRRSSINEKNWTSANAAVDRTTGSSYVVYLDKKNKVFAMCRITVAGAVVAEDVPDLRQSLDSSLPFHLDVSESKKLFICNGNKLFVFTMMSADDS